MNNDTLHEMSEVFIERLEQKNSWGKNEVIALWKDCLLEFVLRGETND